ncbi:UNVERIFIED_ORG: hypothetical protein LHJ69_23520 [Shinella sp. XGS7]|nr:hypothetical protein [Shinella sp. XGS7]
MKIKQPSTYPVRRKQITYGDLKLKALQIVLAASIATGLSSTAFAQVNCIGVPQATKVGEIGAQEPYFIVNIDGLDYRLGAISDDPAAKARLAQATVAMTTGKRLMLRYWLPHTTCSGASEVRAIPNSVQVLQQ